MADIESGRMIFKGFSLNLDKRKFTKKNFLIFKNKAVGMDIYFME